MARLCCISLWSNYSQAGVRLRILTIDDLKSRALSPFSSCTQARSTVCSAQSRPGQGYRNVVVCCTTDPCDLISEGCTQPSSSYCICIPLSSLTDFRGYSVYVHTD
ncbi:hypothetical protein GGR51DRAFT_497885 [Nemania sp. FL0031]|nr:hypothetical protein GGR51DRAFT_497885 [Nemania sp. FL0031]